MIHIATVHWQTDEWIDIQLSYLKRFIAEPFKVYAFLNNIPAHHYTKFDYVCDEPIEEHAIKLNLLGRIISLQAKEDDILIFIDGDAFPVAPLDPVLNQTLEVHPITAILRSESLSDKQPHPSFAATTVGFWNQIQGDWKNGYCWQDSLGRWVSDVGGNLLKKLEDHSISWLPLYRTHSLSEHPLWFGIYHNLIYHHGAGFRDPFCRVDVPKGPFWLKWLQTADSKGRSLQVIISRFREKNMIRWIARKQTPKHQKIYEDILRDQNFITDFLK